MIPGISPLKLIRLSWLTLVVAVLGFSCRADELPSGHASDKAEASSTTGDSALPEVAAKSVQDLRSRVGHELVITGEVARIGISDTGHRFINFQGNPELSLFISSNDVKKFEPETPEKLYDGKSIAATGKLERFKDKLQVRITSPGQIQLMEKAGTPAKPEKLKLPVPVQLKETGREKWVSPAGLRYEGRDPDGRTRKEHVLRHAEDIPDREGPHGVFDGGEETTFAWIDAAWEKIQKEKLKPQSDDGRDTYTVHMGQRVGYMGGETGGRKEHPPLKSIFIVLRQGTTEVITAFPR